MTRFRTFQFIGILGAFFFYLINPEFAISKNETIYLLSDVENALNKKDIKSLKDYFNEDEALVITDKFSNIIDEFGDLNWQITSKTTKEGDENYWEVQLTGIKIIDGEKFVLLSNFDYYFSILNGKIEDGFIRNDLTTIRNDNNFIDINIDIPDRVLSGSNYNLDIIINEPLDLEIYAGGLTAYQEDSLFGQNILLEPLLAGGIFKVTRAPSKPGIQIWTGIIAHKEGLITFTKTVEITQ